MSRETQRQALKERKRKSLNLNACKLLDLAEEKGYRVEHLTPYQFRVNGKVDIYPTSLKYFNIYTKVWGTLGKDFEEELIRLIEK